MVIGIRRGVRSTEEIKNKGVILIIDIGGRGVRFANYTDGVCVSIGRQPAVESTTGVVDKLGLSARATIKSYNPVTSAFDKTEVVEDFHVDSSGYASSNTTLSSDNNGNQTYDGIQSYTYDAWNRLMTVSHGYGTDVDHGQAAVTMSYDAKGRRIRKSIANTGNWDCTYNYFYNGNSVIEEQNGSTEPIKQFVWGTQCRVFVSSDQFLQLLQDFPMEAVGLRSDHRLWRRDA